MDNFWKVISDVRSLLIAAGLALFTLGLVGGITNYIPPMGQIERAAAVLVGLAVAGFGIWLVVKDFRKEVKGIRILSPTHGDNVEERITVRGEIRDEIPEHKELWILRIDAGHNRFVPLRPVHVRSDKTWEATDIHVAGRPKDRRYIGVYVVDRSALVLFDFWNDASSHHNGWMDRLEIAKDTPGRYLPAIRGDPAKIPCMKKGDEVEVTRV